MFSLTAKLFVMLFKLQTSSCAFCSLRILLHVNVKNYNLVTLKDNEMFVGLYMTMNRYSMCAKFCIMIPNSCSENDNFRGLLFCRTP